MKLLANASEEHESFFDLIGTEVTFKSDLVTIGGQLLHAKGSKAIISDVQYNPGRWSRACSDIYICPKISCFKIEGRPHTCYLPHTFLEFQIFG